MKSAEILARTNCLGFSGTKQAAYKGKRYIQTDAHTGM